MTLLFNTWLCPTPPHEVGGTLGWKMLWLMTTAQVFWRTGEKSCSPFEFGLLGKPGLLLSMHYEKSKHSFFSFSFNQYAMLRDVMQQRRRQQKHFQVSLRWWHAIFKLGAKSILSSDIHDCIILHEKTEKVGLRMLPHSVVNKGAPITHQSRAIDWCSLQSLAYISTQHFLLFSTHTWVNLLKFFAASLR